VKALDTLVSDDGNTITIDNYPEAAAAERRAQGHDRGGVARARRRQRRKHSACSTGSTTCLAQAQERLVSQPTVNIEGLVGGYTGPGGKTVLPHSAVAKIDMRLVPGMKYEDAVAALKSHLAKRGFGDIEVNVSGGYNPTETRADSALIQAQLATLRKHGIDPLLWPRNAGSYPGIVFHTNPPLSLPSGHFGLAYGTGAHAPNEY
jgi:acetylornithine deacetylase/succinyl-diaminopimelate desuccinylase-like protein